jgi:hypothetical protein
MQKLTGQRWRQTTNPPTRFQKEEFKELLLCKGGLGDLL